MYDSDFDEEPQFEKFRSKNGEWIECAKCRTLMFDTFKNCWSCGAELTDRNKIPVRI
jgi:hypothetical protein